MKLAAGDLVRERVQAGAEDVHFPEAFVRAVLADLTSPGDVVLDPFADYGTTLVVAEQMDRVGVGVELLAERVALARSRLHGSGRIIEGGAPQPHSVRPRAGGPVPHLPPYMSSVDHPENPLSAYRSRDGDYERYLEELGQVFAAVAGLLRPAGHLVINAATIRTGDVVTPLAWDIARIAGQHLVFHGETYLWWDEPVPWVSGDYCLRFQKAG